MNELREQGGYHPPLGGMPVSGAVQAAPGETIASLRTRAIQVRKELAEEDAREREIEAGMHGAAVLRQHEGLVITKQQVAEKRKAQLLFDEIQAKSDHIRAMDKVMQEHADAELKRELAKKGYSKQMISKARKEISAPARHERRARKAAVAEQASVKQKERLTDKLREQSDSTTLRAEQYEAAGADEWDRVEHIAGFLAAAEFREEAAGEVKREQARKELNRKHAGPTRIGWPSILGWRHLTSCIGLAAVTFNVIFPTPEKGVLMMAAFGLMGLPHIAGRALAKATPGNLKGRKPACHECGNDGGSCSVCGARGDFADRAREVLRG